MTSNNSDFCDNSSATGSISKISPVPNPSEVSLASTGWGSNDELMDGGFPDDEAIDDEFVDDKVVDEEPANVESDKAGMAEGASNKDQAKEQGKEATANKSRKTAREQSIKNNVHLHHMACRYKGMYARARDAGVDLSNHYEVCKPGPWRKPKLCDLLNGISELRMLLIEHERRSGKGHVQIGLSLAANHAQRASAASGSKAAQVPAPRLMAPTHQLPVQSTQPSMTRNLNASSPGATFGPSQPAQGPNSRPPAPPQHGSHQSRGNAQMTRNFNAPAPNAAAHMVSQTSSGTHDEFIAVIHKNILYLPDATYLGSLTFGPQGCAFYFPGMSEPIASIQEIPYLGPMLFDSLHNPLGRIRNAKFGDHQVVYQRIRDASSVLHHHSPYANGNANVSLPTRHSSIPAFKQDNPNSISTGQNSRLASHRHSTPGGGSSAALGGHPHQNPYSTPLTTGFPAVNPNPNSSGGYHTHSSTATSGFNATKPTVCGDSRSMVKGLTSDPRLLLNADPHGQLRATAQSLHHRTVGAFTSNGYDNASRGATKPVGYGDSHSMGEGLTNMASSSGSRPMTSGNPYEQLRAATQSLHAAQPLLHHRTVGASNGHSYGNSFGGHRSAHDGSNFDPSHTGPNRVGSLPSISTLFDMAEKSQRRSG